jgi:type I restriction enzyme S subunit
MAEPLLASPSHWAMTTLEPKKGGPYITHVDSGGTPSTTKEENWDGDIPWLTPKEITRNSHNIFVSATERNITDVGISSSAAKLLPSGTVMLTKRAPVGVVAINAIPMSTNQGFLNFRCGAQLRPLFLAHWFRVNVSYLKQVANGSTYRELYKSDLFEFHIGIPPIEEQDAILSVINALQYVALLGLPIEQSVVSPAEMLRVQDQSRRLEAIREYMTVHLLSGALSAAKVSSLFEAKVNA